MARALSRQRPRTTAARPRAGAEEERRAVLTIRVDFGAFGALGPGKVRLMELISQHGSIASAGKAMGMSYRRAWLLADAINQAFREPLIAKQTGGSGGGGARLTRLGREVVGRYRAIEGAAATASAADLRALRAALAAKPPEAGQGEEG
jgi:molybdate transport system regulatory protein